MDLPDRTVDSGGGAIFQGDITAGRDITINQITEIKQVTELLSSRCCRADASDKFLGSLEALRAAAEFTEEYATELNSSVFASGPLLEKVSRECASILTELKQLEKSLGQDENGQNATTASFNEIVMDIRSRLMSLQMHISNVNSRKTAKDFEAIKKAVTKLMNDHQNSDDASSIRSFFTASSIPYVERQIWHEIEKSLRAQFTTEYVRDHYALIVASVEELVFENTSPWISEGAKPKDAASEAFNTTRTGTTLRLSETYNLCIDIDSEDRLLEVAGKANDDASMHTLYEDIEAVRSGVDWPRSVEDGTGECLLTLDGGGVKSYSSILIIEALMEEVIDCENRFERQFTHYPRTFNASDFRPCHYFHKMYGTSTGGILAIALSRLRMTVTETITAFESILDAMYAHARNLVPLTKHKHSYLEKALVSMVRSHCKQHERGSCDRDEHFRWRSTIYEDPKGQNNSHKSMESYDSDDAQIWASLDVLYLHFPLELQTPEHQLCQTICVTVTHSGQVDEAYLLRTYTHHYDQDILPPWATMYNKDTLDLDIWEVGRATTATPFLFDMLVVNGPEGRLSMKDGGTRENNPSWCAYSEAASLWGENTNPSLLLSIGAGHTISTPDDLPLGGIMPFGLSILSKYAKRVALLKNTLIGYTEGQDRHKVMRTIAKGGQTWYKRFEVIDGLEKMTVDQWESGNPAKYPNGKILPRPGGKTLSAIQTATEAYLNRREADKSFYEHAAPRQMLKQTAEKLVRMRRARELEAMTQGGEKREHWEAFMGKHLIGERDFFPKYQEEWDYALLGRKH